MNIATAEQLSYIFTARLHTHLEKARKSEDKDACWSHHTNADRTRRIVQAADAAAASLRGYLPRYQAWKPHTSTPGDLEIDRNDLPVFASVLREWLDLLDGLRTLRHGKINALDSTQLVVCPSWVTVADVRRTDSVTLDRSTKFNDLRLALVSATGVWLDPERTATT